MNWKKLSVRSIKTISVVSLCTVILLSCSKNLNTSTDSLYVPTATDVTPNATLADLQAGRTLLINNCGRCHGLYSPDNLTVANWKSIVPMMASRAGLNAAQTTQLIMYVTRGK